MIEQHKPVQNGPYVIALDLGTSSVRAVLFDCQGRALEDMSVQEEISVCTDVDGAVEIDADQVLLHLFSCIDGVLDKARELQNDIQGVSMCTFVSNVMGLGVDDRPVTPVYVYADTRPTEEVRELRQRIDESFSHQRTGVHFHSSYLPARFLWLAKTQPEMFGKVKKWISVGEYLFLLLFGDMAVSYSAAAWTGLLNYKDLVWDEEIMKVLPVDPAQFSRLVDINEPFQGLRGEFAVRWSALKDIPWFPALGDGAAANIGSGCARDDRLTISMGTSSAARVVVTQAPDRLPDGLWCYRVDKRRMLLGGAMSEGGSIYGWLRKLLNLDTISDLEMALLNAETDAHGLTFLPLITGERTPGWIPEARGVISGLSIATNPLDVLQAGMEGVCCRIALVYDLVKSAHPKEMEIIASGGAIQGSKAWQHMLVNVLGVPIRISQVNESSARGSALLAFEALGMIADAGDAPDFLSEPIRPDMERHSRFKQVISRQTELYGATIKKRSQNSL